MFYPDLQIVLLVVALLIASSRMILGMHFLSDVLAGSAIGILLGYCSYPFFPGPLTDAPRASAAATNKCGIKSARGTELVRIFETHEI